MRIHTFTCDSQLVDLDELAEEHPSKQTQALLLAIDEARAWIAMAREMIGVPPPKCLAEHEDWLRDASAVLEGIEEDIDDDEDLAQCRQCADDPSYAALDELLDQYPDSELELQVADHNLREAVERLSDFWLENTRKLLVRVQSITSGDGEILRMLSRWRALRSLPD